MNKGEWSELYVFFKLLSEGKLYPADKHLRRTGDSYTISKVFKDDHDGPLDFVVNGESVDVYRNQTEWLHRVPREELCGQADRLLNEISNTAPGERIVAEEAVEYMGDLSVENLKSSSRNKADIRVQIHDAVTGNDKLLGFSIKSQLGSPSTLFNPGRTTNLTYRIENIDEESMHQFNRGDFGQLRKSLNYLAGEKGAKFNYFDISHGHLRNNLMIIDSSLPEIIAQMLLEHYVHHNSRLNEALDEVSRKNPLNYPTETDHAFYEYKVKRFLSEIALGMVPSKIWHGIEDATGGYIIVKDSGELVSFHLYNRKFFEEYLLDNTKFDTPSRNRYGFGQIYKENNDYFIKLNLQIRFIH